jgi:hypothetical protein
MSDLVEEELFSFRLFPGLSRDVVVRITTDDEDALHWLREAIHALNAGRPVPDKVAYALVARVRLLASSWSDNQALDRIRAHLTAGGRLGEPLRETTRHEPPEERRVLSATVAAAQPSVDPSRVLYRLVRAREPSSADFLSNLAKCLPRRGVEQTDPNIWAGLSMFDTPDAAVLNARRFNGRIGRFLAELELPHEGDGRVSIRQTLRPGHFTVLCCEITCISFIRSVQPIVGL